MKNEKGIARYRACLQDVLDEQAFAFLFMGTADLCRQELFAAHGVFPTFPMLH